MFLSHIVWKTETSKRYTEGKIVTVSTQVDVSSYVHIALGNVHSSTNSNESPM